MSPYKTDFSQLRTLRLVYEFRSFSTAAELLEVNQSAISYTIDKLRQNFGDPLFMRQGGGIIATERCSQIVESAIKLLDDFDTIIAPPEFDPQIARDTFTIACNYYERQLVLPAVVKSLNRLAPNIRLNVINSISQGDQQLKRAEAEMLIGPIRPNESGFFCRKLLTDNYVCVIDPGNPLADKPLTIENYIAAKHVVVTYGGNWKSAYLVHLESKGLCLNNVLSVPSPASLPAMIRDTDLIATVPKRVAQSFGKALQITQCPFPAPFDIDLVWTTRTHRSPSHVWARELIFDEISTILNN